MSEYIYSPSNGYVWFLAAHNSAASLKSFLIKRFIGPRLSAKNDANETCVCESGTA